MIVIATLDYVGADQLTVALWSNEPAVVAEEFDIAFGFDLGEVELRHDLFWGRALILT